MSEINSFIVEGGNRKMEVLIPKTGDRAYDNYLMEAEKEKTKKQLEDNPRKESKVPREEVGAALREFNEYKKRKQSGIKKYF